jgi:hypothetical protein
MGSISMVFGSEGLGSTTKENAIWTGFHSFQMHPVEFQPWLVMGLGDVVGLSHTLDEKIPAVCKENLTDKRVRLGKSLLILCKALRTLGSLRLYIFRIAAIA